MKRLFTLALLALSLVSVGQAQSNTSEATAAQTLQPAQSLAPVLQPQKIAEPKQSETLTGESRVVKIPAGTPIEVEAVYTVSSDRIKPGEMLSFRVLIPVKIDGVIAIEKGALVSARVTRSKRGGHWGKAGKLAWTMEDVIAADNTSIPLAPETRVRNEALWSLENKKNLEKAMDQGSVTGTSHGGEVATKTIVTAAAFPLFAPLALMQGFKRGENAVLAEGKRFVVLVRGDSSLTVPNR